MNTRWPRIIAHADMDAFYAAVEQLDNEELRGEPVLVGPRNRRGVVLTASYEARPFGVGSAMPMAEALRRCPDAVVVPPRFSRYTDLSATIMSLLDDFSPDVEPLSLDEAFLDMSGAESIFGEPQQMGAAIKAAVKRETGLVISVGIAHCKYVAKVASGVGKPDGLTVVPPDDAVDWLAPLPVKWLWGAGPKTQARLEAAGYLTIADVARAPVTDLTDQFGAMGSHFHEIANARDPRRIEGGRRSRSLGSERTLSEDVSDQTDIERHLQRSADRIARRLRQHDLLAGGVRVRLKTTDFQSMTRQSTFSTPTDVASELLTAAIELLPRFEHPGPFRLVGMAAHSLHEHNAPQQLDLLEDHRARRLETTLDSLTDRFGDGVVQRAKDVSKDTVIDSAPNLDRVRNRPEKTED